MRRIIRLTENDLARIVRRVINENENETLELLFNGTMYGVKGLIQGKVIGGYVRKSDGKMVPGRIQVYFGEKGLLNFQPENGVYKLIPNNYAGNVNGIVKFLREKGYRTAKGDKPLTAINKIIQLISSGTKQKLSLDPPVANAFNNYTSKLEQTANTKFAMKKPPFDGALKPINLQAMFTVYLDPETNEELGRKLSLGSMYDFAKDQAGNLRDIEGRFKDSEVGKTNYQNAMKALSSLYDVLQSQVK